MLKSNLVYGALALSLLIGCGGHPKTAADLSTEAADGAPRAMRRAATPADGIAIAVAEPVDLTPVPAPGARVLHLRWENPRDTITTLAGFGTLPSNMVEGAMQEATRQFTRKQFDHNVDTKALGDLINLDAPIEMVIVVIRSDSGEPQPIAALSLGISSLERARASSRVRSRKLSPGIWRIGEEPDFGSSCVLAASAGVTPARLICADNQREALTLARYMATTLTLEPTTNSSDISVALTIRGVVEQHREDIAKVADKLRGEASSLARKFPSLGARSQLIVDALANELIHATSEADGITFELDADTNRGIRVRAQLRFASRTSWTAGTMTADAAFSDVAPDIFWSLPASSGAASYGHSVDPSVYDDILSVLRDGISDMMKKEKFGTPADRAALVKLLRLPVSKHVAAVSANGHFAPSGTGSSSDTLGLIDNSLGWYLYGIDEGPSKTKAYLRELVRAYNRPTLQRVMRQEFGRDVKHFPTVKIVPAPVALGGQRMAIEVVVPNLPQLPSAGGPNRGPAAKPRVTDVKMHLLLSSSGKRTWIGMSTQRDELVKLMASLRQGAAVGLGTRADLTMFRTQKHAAGSFTEMLGVTNAMKPLAEMAFGASFGISLRPGPRILAAFSNMPNGGKAPIVSFVDVDETGAPTTTMTFQMPRESLQDLGFLISETIAAIAEAT